MALALFTWFFLTPSLVEMKTFQVDWIAFIYGRNLILMFLIFGGWHLRFHMIKAQGTKYSFNTNWPQEKHRRFFFNNQVYDNMFHSVVSGCTIWTSYEVITMWAFANNLIPFLSWEPAHSGLLSFSWLYRFSETLTFIWFTAYYISNSSINMCTPFTIKISISDHGQACYASN